MANGIRKLAARTRNRPMKALRAIVFVVVLMAGSLVLLSLPHQQAFADTGLVRRGDAQAIFNVALNGCGAIVAHGSVQEGQPCEDFLRAQLRLFASLPTQHYCVDDWHVIRITVNDTPEALDAFSATFVVDGQPLETTRTPVKPVNPKYAQQLGLTPAEAFWINIGTIVPPTALSVGTHTSHVETFFPAPGPVFDRVFVIDPSGTGACLLP